MPEFGVFPDSIREVRKHPNADRLELVTLTGFEGSQMVVPKERFAAGDEVFYFQIDSLIPEDIQSILGVKGYLSGPNKNRVKTIRLRGEFSQGIVAHQKDFPNIAVSLETTPAEIAAALNVTKYEPSEQITKTGRLITLPVGLTVYDIDGCQSSKPMLDYMLDQPAFITEKCDGSNFSATYDTEGKLYVCSRRFAIENIEGQEPHSFWQVAERSGILEFLQFKRMVEVSLDQPPQALTIYGEMIGPGIQGNYYGLPRHTVRIFDVKVGDRFLSGEKFCDIMQDFTKYRQDSGYPEENMVVPILCAGDMTLRQYLELGPDADMSTAIQAVIAKSNGKSLLAPAKLREGIVMRLWQTDEYLPRGGRVILKQRDPVYLAGTEN